MVNKWIQHVKEYAKNNNLSYACALSNLQCKEYYKDQIKPTKIITKQRSLKEINEDMKKNSLLAKKESSKMRRNIRKIFNSQTETTKKNNINKIIPIEENIEPPLMKIFKKKVSGLKY
jgi:hypothetical protein